VNGLKNTLKTYLHHANTESNYQSSCYQREKHRIQNDILMNSQIEHRIEINLTLHYRWCVNERKGKNMLSDNKNFFKVLSRIDVSKYAQKRNGLDYLPWAVAWRILRENYPESFYTVYETPNGCNYHSDGRSVWVKVGLTLRYPDDNNFMQELENVEYLAVMDYRHQSIPLDKVRSTDVINTIQRALCKCAARFGIGISLYGADLDDLPEAPKTVVETVVEKKSEKPVQTEQPGLEVTVLHQKLETALKEYSKEMSRTEKVKFINETVVKVLNGERNYKLCDDPKLLNALLDIVTVKETKEAA